LLRIDAIVDRYCGLIDRQFRNRASFFPIANRRLGNTDPISQYQQLDSAGIVSISNGQIRLPSHPVQQMPIADTTWKNDLKTAMNSIGMFDNTKESLCDLLEEIHTGRVQLPDLQRSFTWCNEQNDKQLMPP
jgi:hypothetical protein